MCSPGHRLHRRSAPVQCRATTRLPGVCSHCRGLCVFALPCPGTPRATVGRSTDLTAARGAHAAVRPTRQLAEPGAGSAGVREDDRPGRSMHSRTRTAPYVPFVVAMYVLPGWYASGWRRGPWMRPARRASRRAGGAHRRAVRRIRDALGGRGVRSAGWPGPGFWLPSPRRPSRRTPLLVGLEIALWLVVGLPYEPRVNRRHPGLLVAFRPNQSLILYGPEPAWADHVDALDAGPRPQLARPGSDPAATRRDHTSGARPSRTRLHRIAERIEAAPRRGGGAEADPGTSWARPDALGACRLPRMSGRLVVDLPESTLQVRPGRPGPVGPAARPGPSLSRWLLLFARAVPGEHHTVPVAKPRPGAPVRPWPAVLVAAVVVLLSASATPPRPRATGRAAGPLTLALLAALCLAFYPTTGASSPELSWRFLAASGLLLIRHWSRWPATGARVRAWGLPGPRARRPDPAPEPRTLLGTITWATYARGPRSPAASLLIFGLARLTQTAAQLEASPGNRSPVAARVRERLRLARERPRQARAGTLDDRVEDRSRGRPSPGKTGGRSRREAIQGPCTLARLVAIDVEAVQPATGVTFTVATEVATAPAKPGRGRPAAREFDVDPDVPDLDGLGPPSCARAVTNVLRHSRADVLPDPADPQPARRSPWLVTKRRSDTGHRW